MKYKINEFYYNYTQALRLQYHLPIDDNYENYAFEAAFFQKVFSFASTDWFSLFVSCNFLFITNSRIKYGVQQVNN
jgi:hypothetical protein